MAYEPYYAYFLDALMQLGGSAKGWPTLYQRLSKGAKEGRYRIHITKRKTLAKTWNEIIPSLESEGLIQRRGNLIEITEAGKSWLESYAGRREDWSVPPIMPKNSQPPSEPQVKTDKAKTKHAELCEIAQEVGNILGYIAEREYKLNGERLDVAWKKVVMGVPHVALEINVGGNTDHDLLKLKHACDLWNCTPILIASEEHLADMRARGYLLGGAFHEIREKLKLVSHEALVRMYEKAREGRQLREELGLD